MSLGTVEGRRPIAGRRRKNSLFYKTRRGAHVGDRSVSLMHTC